MSWRMKRGQKEWTDQWVSCQNHHSTPKLYASPAITLTLFHGKTFPPYCFYRILEKQWKNNSLIIWKTELEKMDKHLTQRVLCAPTFVWDLQIQKKIDGLRKNECLHAVAYVFRLCLIRTKNVSVYLSGCLPTYNTVVAVDGNISKMRFVGRDGVSPSSPPLFFL